MDQEQIKRDVVDNLYWDTRVDASEINVDVDEDGNVTLEGTVPSYRAKMAATLSAWTVNGVLTIDNQVAVSLPTEITLPTDDEIKSNIQNSLLWNPDLVSTDIEVSVENGIVTLEGSVDSYWKLYLAENEADVQGVIDMVNKLTVVPSEDILDEDIAEDVVNALERNANVDVDDVTVKVEDGGVTLTGSVPSWYAYTSAEDSAFYTLGVTEVDNQLVVQYQEG